MTTKKAVRPIPEGYHAVTPFVIATDAVRFLQFMTEAFGAEELGRVVLENGKIGHAEARIGDSVVMTFDAKDGWPDTPAFLRIYVEVNPEEEQRRYGASPWKDALADAQNSQIVPG